MCWLALDEPSARKAPNPVIPCDIARNDGRFGLSTDNIRYRGQRSAEISQNLWQIGQEAAFPLVVEGHYNLMQEFGLEAIWRRIGFVVESLSTPVKWFASIRDALKVLPVIDPKNLPAGFPSRVCRFRRAKFLGLGPI